MLRPERSRFREGGSIFDDYALRAQIGLVLALTAVVGLAQVPWYRASGLPSWSHGMPSESIMLSEFEMEAPKAQSRRVAPKEPDKKVNTAVPPVVQDLGEGGSEREEEDNDVKGSNDGRRGLDIVSIATLGPDDRRPSVLGGMNALYVNIEYPYRAIQDGIQGRLFLTFVVDTEGRPRDITVARGLHPLCDSAAVRGIRNTKFVPGLADGRTVPVRMTLPVQFRLIDVNSSPQAPAPDSASTRPSSTEGVRTAARDNG